MKVCVLNGGPRKKSNTYKVYEEVKAALQEHDTLEITEFSAMHDFPDNCIGCYNCINKTNETKCPHREKVEPIEKAIIDCDILILLSPVYVLSVTSYMKALLDHFGYRYVVHRPHPSMRCKSALVISTAAGNATGRTNKFMADNLSFWGIPKIQKIGLRVFALNYDAMAERKKKKIKKQAKKTAKKLYKNYLTKDKQSFTLKFKFYKSIIKSTVKSYGAGNPDYDYWGKMGWL